MVFILYSYANIFLKGMCKDSNVKINMKCEV